MKDVGYAIGDRVKFKTRQPYGTLVHGQPSTVISIEPGTLPGDTYTVVKTDEGTLVTAYAWRFEKI